MAAPIMVTIVVSRDGSKIAGEVKPISVEKQIQPGHYTAKCIGVEEKIARRSGKMFFQLSMQLPDGSIVHVNHSPMAPESLMRRMRDFNVAPVHDSICLSDIVGKKGTISIDAEPYRYGIVNRVLP